MTRDEVLGRKVKPSTVSLADGSKFIGAVFLYVLLGLVVTGLVATGFGVLFERFIYVGEEEVVMKIFTIALISSLLLYIPAMIWCQIAAARKSKTMVPAFIFYAITMGALISTSTIYVPFYEIAIAFGGTCLAFGLMTLIAWCSKGNFSTLRVIGSGLIFGSFIIFLINLPIQFLLPELATPTMWLISFIMLIGVVLITTFDIKRVKQIAASGGAENNVALLCGISLYVDFIYIFLRILALIGKLRK